MQTFLPHKSFEKTASVLDYRRLGKQRVENLQILKALLLPEYGWKNHPAVKMWDGYVSSLLDYHTAICNEWVNVRGYKDTCLEKAIDFVVEHVDDMDAGMPPWLGDDDLHLSHQSNLVRKAPEFYGPIFPDVPDNLEYVWPEV